MTRRRMQRAALALAVLLVACLSGTRTQNGEPETDAAAAAARAGRWQSLFDGKTMNAWRGYKETTVPAGWSVVDGTISKTGSTGDLISREQFTNFELEIDWKIGTGGNSGIFYRATEEYDHIYWSGPEYQLLDDWNAPDGKSRLTAAGADYGLYPAPEGFLKPANEWNFTRIVVRGDHVEHWLNGTRLLEYEFGSTEWLARLKASKFAAWPNYGKATIGHIGIQGDHPGSLALRNIRIRRLN